MEESAHTHQEKWSSHQPANNFFVITGGPGAGKTTLLEALKKRNCTCVPEVARDIIKEQIKKNGDALPWKNTEFYKELMLQRSVDSYKKALDNNAGIVFFDRGIPDTLCYARLLDTPITEEMDFCAKQYRYNKKVFMLPPWYEIYETDNERKQTWEEAVETHTTMKDMYLQYGYEITEVPKTTIGERVDFILSIVSPTPL